MNIDKLMNLIIPIFLCKHCINEFPHFFLNDNFILAILPELVSNPLDKNNDAKNIPFDEIDSNSYFYGLQQKIRQNAILSTIHSKQTQHTQPM